MKKTSISKKTTRLIIIAISIIAIFLLIAGFISIRAMRFRTVGYNQQHNAEIFSNFIAQQVESEINNIEMYLSSSWWQDEVKKANLRYVNWEPKSIKEYMARMDEQWFSGAVDTPFVQEWLSSRISQRLKALSEQSGDIAEIFLTDKYGGLVAASGKTSDFYQADELWWQRAYNNGKGDIFLGEVNLDKSSKKISIAMAVPIKDGTGQVIGVSKVVLDVAVFFQQLSKYKFGKTGHMALYEANGNVIYHVGLKPMSNAVLSGFELDQSLRDKDGFKIIMTNCLKTKSIVAAARVKSRLLEDNRIGWVVAVTQSKNEVFFPLYKIFGIGFILVLIVSILITIVMQNSIQHVFISPLEKILDGVQHFSDNDLDYRIDIKTADEFELLAKSLNKMSEHLKQTMVLRDNLTLENEQRKKIELQLDFSLKESLKSREILLNMLDDNNKARENLNKSIAELEKAQAQLEETRLQLIQSAKMAAIGTLSASVAHDINNPLMGIMLLLESLMIEKEKGTKEQEVLSQIENGLKRIASIVAKLLEFSRKENLILEKKNINEVIDLTLPLIMHEFKLNEIRLIKSYGKDLPQVEISVNEMQQAITNILLNAKDASLGSKVKEISIATYLEDDMVKINIKDKGIGMKKEVLSNVFKPFFTTKPIGKGLGIGTSIVKNIISKHYGKIEIFSEEQKGTEVIISLPLSKS